MSGQDRDPTLMLASYLVQRFRRRMVMLLEDGNEFNDLAKDVGRMLDDTQTLIDTYKGGKA